MKRIISILTVLVAMFSFIACEGGAETTEAAAASNSAQCGFIIDGDKVTFTFDVKHYATFDPIEEATLAGEFNGWDPVAADWQMTDEDGDGVWTFETDLATVPCGSKFKFVGNQVDWMQPDAAVLDKKYLADDGFGGFNLVMSCE